MEFGKEFKKFLTLNLVNLSRARYIIFRPFLYCSALKKAKPILFNSLPDLHKNVHRLQPIRGLMPDPMALPEGCNFADRCDLCDASCRESEPHVVEVEPGHLVKCKKC